MAALNSLTLLLCN